MDLTNFSPTQWCSETCRRNDRDHRHRSASVPHTSEAYIPAIPGHPTDERRAERHGYRNLAENAPLYVSETRMLVSYK